MAVKIVRPGGNPSSTDVPEGSIRVGNIDFEIEKIEGFGRLDMSYTQIADWYGVSSAFISNAMRRSDLKRAYRKGRVEATVSVRQKSFNMALGGDTTQLNNALKLFGDLDEKSNEKSTTGEIGKKYDWDKAIEVKIRIARENIEAEVSVETDDEIV